MEGEENKMPKISASGISKFKRVCVYCGSRVGHKAAYSIAALELAKLLVDRQIDLVYGGGSVGLMGLVSQTVFNGGRHVLGSVNSNSSNSKKIYLQLKFYFIYLFSISLLTVIFDNFSVIPTDLLPMELLGETTGEVKIVSDMHQRKSEMAKYADAFIALPGGYGTMEELLEIITWSQLGIHTKPVGILNVDGYYDSLLALFDKGVEEGFIEHSARQIIISASNPAELLQKMEANTLDILSFCHNFLALFQPLFFCFVVVVNCRNMHQVMKGLHQEKVRIG
ncbi:hypothetical protein QQ045_004788 [Rhodiola kirilowii]